MSKTPEKWKLSPEAFEERNTKVRITMYVDLDVLKYFKARAAADGQAYQTQMNAELRRSMETDQSGDDAANLLNATRLIESVRRNRKKM